MPTKPTCRLFVLFARDADVAVILRRGPSRWAQIVKWDTRHDEFEDGAWFHGRIDENACDISPDGELFVYFAQKYRWYSHDDRYGNDEYGHAWTAVSRPPWLYALALWPNPSYIYPGGGRFAANRQLTLLTVGFDVAPHSQHPPPRQLSVDRQNWDDYEHKRKQELEGVDWSGRDQRGHIVYAQKGKLYRRVNSQDNELIDLNNRASDPQPAPAWARHLARRET